MSRSTPLEYDKVYHIYNRGINRSSLFFEPKNYSYFLSLYRKHLAPVAGTFAFCLLENHFHLLIRIRSFDTVSSTFKGSPPVLFRPFSNFFNAYTKAINKAYGRTGKLFEESFKRKEVATEEYFTQLIYYIHSNPQHHGLRDDFRTYPHSSYPLLANKLPSWLEKEEVLDFFGGLNSFLRFHQERVEHLQEVLAYFEE